MTYNLYSLENNKLCETSCYSCMLPVDQIQVSNLFKLLILLLKRTKNIILYEFKVK